MNYTLIIINVALQTAACVAGDVLYPACTGAEDEGALLDVY